MSKWSVDNDGVEHINVYSQGKTWLGRMLSNFAHTPFEHPEDGSFESVEGYWYWLGSGDDKLRELHGWAAKAYGRKIKAPDWLDGEAFKNKIRAALEAKLNAHPDILQALIDNDIPLTHYYVYGNKQVFVRQGDWILEALNVLKEKLDDEPQGEYPDLPEWDDGDFYK